MGTRKSNNNSAISTITLLMNIKEVHNQILNCERCHLCKDFAPVPGDGNPSADLMLIGEALGGDEQLTGKPFVGMAGQFLDKMLVDAGINRYDCYVSNVVHGRPTKSNGRSNRPPSQEEINACKINIWNEIQVVSPKIIITLGRIPTFTLLSKPINTRLRDFVGAVVEVHYMSAKIVVNFHPSYVMAHSRKDRDRMVEVFKSARELLEI